MDPETVNFPELDNQFAADRMLRNALAHRLPESVSETVHNSLHEEGARQQQQYAHQQSLEDKTVDRGRARAEDDWGRPARIATVPSTWHHARRAYVEHGLVERPQTQPHGKYSRFVQMAFVHLLAPEAPGLIPLIATTDVAVHTLMRHGTADHLERLVPRLTSTDPKDAWLCDLWGTSHLLSAPDDTVRATPVEESKAGESTWALQGRVLTRSATYPDAALVVARDPGGERCLFLIEQPARTDGMQIDAPVPLTAYPSSPSATVQLNGVHAEQIASDVGRRGPAPFLQYIWDAVLTVSQMRRVLALTRGAAETWHVQEQELAYNSLIQESLADMQARYESAFTLTYQCVQALGRMEADDAPDANAPVRVLAPLAKSHAAHQASEVATRALHLWGRPALRTRTRLHAASDRLHALAALNGSPHDLALRFLHVVEHHQQLGHLRNHFESVLQTLSVETLIPAMKSAVLAFRDASQWVDAVREKGGDALEAGAGRFTRTVGNALATALMIDHAEWALNERQDGRPAAAVERFATTGLSHIRSLDPHDAYVLTWDFNCPTLFECHSGTAAPSSVDSVESML